METKFDVYFRRSLPERTSLDLPSMVPSDFRIVVPDTTAVQPSSVQYASKMKPGFIGVPLGFIEEVVSEVCNLVIAAYTIMPHSTVDL